MFMFAATGFSACGFHQGYIGHQIQTNVELSEANFEYVKAVEGSASATYVFGIGGLGKKTLIGNAKAEMMKKAGLEGSQAVINVSTDLKVSNYVVFVQYKATVSGDVVQFK